MVLPASARYPGFYRDGRTGPPGRDGTDGTDGVDGADGGPGPLGMLLTYKGDVADVPSLPTEGNTAGDTYTITGTATSYAWDGSGWASLGEADVRGTVEGETSGQAVVGIGLKHPTEEGKYVETWLGATEDGGPTDYAIDKLNEAGIAGAVDSVNGQTGAVVLDAADVGALPDDTVIPDGSQSYTFPVDDDEDQLAYARTFADGKRTFVEFNRYGRPSPWSSQLIGDALTRSGVMVSSVQGKAGAVSLRADELDDDLLAPLVRTIQKPVPAYPSTTLGGIIKGIYNNAAKWHLNTWLPANYPGTGQIENFGGITEGEIRPPLMVASGLAHGIAAGAYDGTATSVTEADALAQAVRIIEASARLHIANNEAAGIGGGSNASGYWSGTLEEPPTLSGPFGRIWQSALWAYDTIYAAWMIWDELTDTTQEHVARMLVHECDRMLRYRTEYQFNREDTPITGGDSKTEEVSWNTGPLNLAVAMLPTHPRAPLWLAKAVEMGMAAGARHADVDRTDLVNGVAPTDMLEGSNTNDSYVVVNHGIRNPRYQNGPGYASQAFAMTNIPMPAAALFNSRERWRVYSTYTFGNPVKTMYEPGSGTINYPDGNNSGTHIHTLRYASNDIKAALLGWDDGMAVTAWEWAELHAQDTADMQARFTDGHTYLDSTEDNFHAAEQTVLTAASASALQLAVGAPDVSNAPVPILAQQAVRRWRNTSP